VAAVPGGGIIVMLPVLEQHLGFSNEMLSLIMMLYILFDAVSTTANVLGNGAFSVIFTKIFRKITSSISS
jgi:Na+/H+-dicarboxylate symporter